MKILVIDDEMLDLFLSKKFLETEFQVEGFTSMNDAVAWAKNNSFDVLLSDYYLGNGVQALDVLKALIEIKGNSFKSFVVTNYVDGEKVQQLKQGGFNGIIDKPLDLQKVKKALGI